ncbi:MAG: phosphoenolpyruvate synthase [Granulosicoccus sp.]
MPMSVDSTVTEKPTKTESYVTEFSGMRREDVARFGGKNSSLGEMVNVLSQQAIQVPPGFATSANAFRQFVNHNAIDAVMEEALDDLSEGRETLQVTGLKIRSAFLAGEWPVAISQAIMQQYDELCKRMGRENIDVAVRSSATAEDLPDASFAGQQETFLNIRGREATLEASRRCYASLFTDRAISYRIAKGFDHRLVALSVGIQVMVRSDKGGSGVMFTIDTESGYDKVVVINAAWGLGETVVQGSVDPDEYRLFKPFLDNEELIPVIGKQRGGKAIKMIYSSAGDSIRTVPTSKLERESFVLGDSDIIALGRAAVTIERHYGCPMDIEWAKDGLNSELYIVQARPETVQSRRDINTLKNYKINNKGEVLISGIGIGSAVITGTVCLIDSPEDIDKFVDGSILVTKNTDPDWVPIMKRAAAIVTDHGGRTSHAAIVSRELGLPAIVGTGDATRRLHGQQEATVSCAEGDLGFVYEGFADFSIEQVSIDDIPDTDTSVMLNLGNPDAAMRWWQLPADGIGLARMEFVISNHVKVHPMALVRYASLTEGETKNQITELTRGYPDKQDYFVDTLSRGLAQIAATVWPKPVIVRMSDFKTNEYANLLGGTEFEPEEENPMLGFRGASRYYSERYREGFALECRSIKRLREKLGFDNVIVMVPFCRTVAEADRVLEQLADNGLARGEKGLKIYVMCEIPSNVVLASRFAERFDGFSIGSNDLTQLTLGVDRDSELLSDLFDEQDEAVEWMIEHLIQESRKSGTKTGICGQAPSDHPEFARFLVAAGIDSISVTPDSFLSVKRHVAAAESANR